MRAQYLWVLDADKKPVECHDVVAWGTWFQEHYQDRIVAKSEIGKALVSTVFLGIDHNFSECGDPVLWETLVIGGEHDGTMERYSSFIDAATGHARICAELLSNLKGESS